MLSDAAVPRITFICPVANRAHLHMGKERTPLSVRDRIILHIDATLKKSGGRHDLPVLTQTGIAEVLNITRAHAAIELERGAGKDVFFSRRARTGNSKRELKVYLLTPAGADRAARLEEELSSARMVEESLANPSRHSPAMVLKELGDREISLLAALRMAGPLEASFVQNHSRVPFVVRNGRKLQISEFAVGALDSMLVEGSRMRDASSFLADYCLNAGDHPGRLGHLVESGRITEAARLVDRHAQELQDAPASDVIAPLLSLENWMVVPDDMLLLVASRALMQLSRNAEALDRLGRIREPKGEHLLTKMLAEMEAEGQPLAASEVEGMRQRATGERERSLYQRLRATSMFLSGDLERAEREVVKAVKISSRSGDTSELGMNYRLFARIERGKGDYAEAARVESKLSSLETARARRSEGRELLER